MRRHVSMLVGLAAFGVSLALVGGCGDGGTGGPPANGVPKFASSNYIELAGINRVSRFRSGFGHDYSDSLENCRSMKHYFQPSADMAEAPRVFSPADGVISRIEEERTSGQQVHIRPHGYQAFDCVLFHVTILQSVHEGDEVASGQQLGTHTPYGGCSDIAVSVENAVPGDWKLISYFEVITDAVFAEYQARGVVSRNQMIISKEERDADPLTCLGEWGLFTSQGNIENWVNLN